MQLRLIPLRRQTGRHRELVRRSFPLQAKQPRTRAKSPWPRTRADARCCAQGREELAGEQLRHRTWILRPGQVGILHQVGIRGETAAVAILRNRNPTGVERPYGSLVITDGIVKRYRWTQVARAPVGRELRRCPAVEHGLGMLQTVAAIPGSNRRKDGRARVRAAVGVAAEGVKPTAGKQILLLDRGADLRGPRAACWAMSVCPVARAKSAMAVLAC